MSAELLACIIAIMISQCGIWYVLGSLKREVKGHNKRLDYLSDELKTHYKNIELNRIRLGGEQWRSGEE